jgi:hypothetical protein
MKTPFATLPVRMLQLLLPLLVCLAALGGDDPKQVRSYVIGVSPFLENPMKDQVYRKVIAFVVEEMSLGSTLRVYDAYNLQTITELQIPEVQAFKSSKTRANQFAAQIHKLKLFLATEHPKPGRTGSQFTGGVRLPQFMDFLRSATVPSTEPLTVIVLGSPLYMDPKEPSFSMADGYYPSDGHLRVGREKSVYGVADRTNSLLNVSVHLAYFGDPWVSDLHQEKVRRFWRLFLETQGGTLTTFSGDVATAFKNARLLASPDAPLTASVALDPAQTKVEMFRITRDVASRDWITRDDISPAGRPPSTTVGPMKIGIRWQGDWDLDLYASAKPAAETLFFQHTRCPEGYYYKDHRSSPGREYEFIEFTTPVDINEVEVMVNFYAGAARGGAAGEVRIEFDDKIYSGTFRIPGTEGNKGRLNASQAQFWATLNIPGILHVRSAERVAVNRRDQDQLEEGQ